MERCATCQHWDHDDEGVGSLILPAGWHPCRRTAAVSVHFGTGVVLPQDGTLAVVDDASATPLLTAPDFGCVQWEAKADA